MILNNNNKIITNKIIMNLNIVATRKNTSLSKKMKKCLGKRVSINIMSQNIKKKFMISMTIMMSLIGMII